MRQFSPAKLNLFLHITGRKSNGYHNLQSIFCPLDFGDFLTFTITDKNAPLLTLTGADGLTDHITDNLIYQAVNTLSLQYPTHTHPLAIHLEKHIPTGAGLGGGSSNCATTLLALNQLWQLNLSTQTLIDIGASLGADVPFFIFTHIYRSSAIVEGIGEKLYPIDIPKYEFLLLMPEAHISTAQFFAESTLKRDCPNHAHEVLKSTNFYQPPKNFSNVFEPLAITHSPKIAEALAYLRTHEHLTHSRARMTGTGSVVFLPFVHLDDGIKNQLIKNAPCPAIFTKLLK